MKVGLPAILGGLLFGCTGILALSWTVISIMRGGYLTALVAAGFATTLLSFSLPLLKVVAGRVFPRGEWNVEGTTIRPDFGIEVPAVAGVCAGVVACGLFAVFFPLGKIDIPVPAGLRFLLPFVAAMFVVVAIPIAYRILRSGGLYRLRMDAEGFVVNAGGRRPQNGCWSEVASVTDSVPGRSAIDDPNTIVIVMSDESVIKLPGASFTPEGRALRQLVRFYWRHPDKRDELTDGRALGRLENENFRATS